jgi:hypothetical protein
MTRKRGRTTYFGLEEGDVRGDDDEGDSPEFEVAGEREERVGEGSSNGSEVLVAAPNV